MAAPKYREIAARLAAEVADLPLGTRIDSEHAVAERFGVGRAAARASVQELERRHLVRRVRGLGTFTSRRVDYEISARRRPSWSQTLRDSGARPRTVVRSCEVEPLPAGVAEVLGRSTGEPCHVLRRRSFTDDLPASWGTEWVPVSVVRDLTVAMRVEESLDRVLRDLAGADPTRGWVRASMESADDDVADELGFDPGAATWYVVSMNQDGPSGPPLYLTQRWIRADAVRVVLEMGTPTPAAPGSAR